MFGRWRGLGEHEQARDISETTEFRNEEIVNAAEVYHIIGDHDKAREYAIRAYKSAWVDGPPWWYLERAKRVLDKLGEPYPNMPPYDAGKIGKSADR